MAHLLIVEDDELLRDGLAAQLGLAGHQTTTAANGALAQEQLEATRFDGVVLDLGLAWRCCAGSANACWPCRY